MLYASPLLDLPTAPLVASSCTAMPVRVQSTVNISPNVQHETVFAKPVHASLEASPSEVVRSAAHGATPRVHFSEPRRLSRSLSRCGDLPPPTPEEKRFLASVPFDDNYDASPSPCGSTLDSDDDPDYTFVHTDTEPSSDDAEIRPLPTASAKPYKWKPMVPRLFDGTECFTNWWTHIENVIEYNGWTEHETMLQLRNLFLGDAADVLWTRDRKPVRSFAVIARQLYLKYADTRRRELHLMELHSYRRRPGEDLIALHARTLRLIAMCHPDWRAKDRQQTGMYYFLDALDDELSSKVRDHLPDTLDKPLEIAIRLEALHVECNKPRSQPPEL